MDRNECIENIPVFLSLSLYQSIDMFQFENSLTDFDEILRGCYYMLRYTTTVLFNYLQSIIQTWEVVAILAPFRTERLNYIW
jgi:hypothetical protein